MKKNINLLINDRAGLISSLKSIEPYPGLPQIKRYLATIHRMDPVTNNTVLFTGSGFSLCDSSAKWSAVGEAVERSSASITHNKNIIKSSYNNLKENAIDLFKITRLDKNQYENQDFYRDVNNDIILYWIKGIDLCTNETIFLPIDLVYLFIPPYRPIREILSTGLACGQSIEKATLSAFLECVERDAFTLFWLMGLVKSKIIFDKDIDPEISNLLQTGIDSNLSLEVYDITQDINVPTILTIVKQNNRNGFYVSCASDLNYQIAVKKSLSEALGGYSIMFEKVFVHKYKVPKNFEDINTLEHGALFYMSGKGDWILKKVFGVDLPSRDFSELVVEPVIDLNTAILNLKEKGHNVYLVDITNSDFSEAGLKVVRVVIPTLAYLSFEQPLLNSKRIESLKLLNNREINMYPHPMP